MKKTILPVIAIFGLAWLFVSPFEAAAQAEGPQEATSSIAALTSCSGCYSITLLSGTTVQPGESVQFSWIAPAEDNLNRDWIGVFRTESPNQSYLKWRYVGSAQGSGSLTVPSEAGTYELRYLKNNGYTSVAESPQFVVGDGGGGTGGSYELTVSPQSVAVGGAVTVSWQSPSGENISQDWVSVFKVGESNQSYRDWEYVTQQNGTATLQAPTEPGSYEVRYLKNNGYTDVKRSQAFIVQTGGGGGGGTEGEYRITANKTDVRPGESIQATWIAPASANLSRDWVGIFKVGTSNQAFLDWEYTNNRPTGTTTLLAPANVGEYELRYLKNNGYTSVASSPAFRVETQTVPSDAKIIAFGDSLVAGFGATEGNDFVSRLSAKTGRSIENQGRIGDTTGEALSRLEDDVISKNPDIVIVLIGGNDVIQRFSKQYTISNLQTIITTIKDSGAQVVLVGIHSTIYGSDYRNLANETGSFYVPDVLSGILGRDDLTVDRFHPNDAGYNIVAERIYVVLRTLL